MSRDLLGYEAALAIIRDACTHLPAETIPVADSIGRILAETLESAIDLPPFNNSAMDGFALRGGDTPVSMGTELAISGEQAAGDNGTHGGGKACAIMTGARLPDGFDRVIPVEYTESLARDAQGQATRIRLGADVRPAQNVRAAGSDVRRYTPVLAAGTVLESKHLMLLAALGVARVTVCAQPRVAVLCTGRELVDDPAVPLASGQIRNSNGPFLIARLCLAGAKVVHSETVGDDESVFEAALARARTAGARIVLSTGAVSVGRYDFVPRVLERKGATTLFHKVAIRPGKPLLFARLPEGTLLFGLPGNPIAVAVGMRFFVEPALRAMAGLAPETPLRVPLADGYQKRVALRMHLKARLRAHADGRLSAHILDGQQSYRIRPLAEANAWVVIPPAIDALPEGALVDVYGLGHNETVHYEVCP